MKKALIVFFLIFVTAIVSYTFLDDPHKVSEDKCGGCHSDTVRAPRKMTESITSICKSCHKKNTRRSSHPVDVTPSMMKIPADLPLSNGMITCNTCHNYHGRRLNAFGGKTYFLRRPTIGREFCISCHETKAGKESHIELVAVSHLRGKYSVTDENLPLDKMSMDCLSCHDGSIASKIDGYRSGIWSDGAGSHPIGVSYTERRMRNGNLKPMGMLNKSLRFYNGNIGCGTCHDYYSKIPKQLVIDHRRLCQECHEK